MSLTFFIILIIILPFALLMVAVKMAPNKIGKKPNIGAIIILVLVAGAIVLGVWAPRVYVVYEEDGEVTYYTHVVFSSYTYETEDGEEIEIDPVPFGCGVLNLLDDDLGLYPQCYGDCSGDWGGSYTINDKSYEPTEEWNIDIFPGEEIPDDVSSEGSTEIRYVLYVD